MARPYNALNGQEALEVLLSMIRRDLEATGEFPVGVTFPCLDIDYRVHFRVYPRENPDIEAEGALHRSDPKFKPDKLEVAVEGTVQKAVNGIGAEVVGDSKTENVELRPGISPDELRKEHGLKALRPELTKEGQVVEK